MKTYKKDIIFHPDFYITTYTKKIGMPYLIFIHGGPGFNCGIIEQLIEHHHLFNALNYNIALYDQRNCGRSKKFANKITHQDNVNDLEKIILYLTETIKIKIIGLIGHSYGAKILYDYYKNYHAQIPGIFLATSNSILTPKLNNLILDLSYLKKTNPTQYKNTLNELENLDLKKMWAISEKLTPLFQENKDRSYLYWANLESLKLIHEIQKQINLPMNTETFIDIRKDLYSSETNFSVEINDLDIPKLWINGLHDFIMNGQESLFNDNIITFLKSAHYPHIEENDRFTKLINEFFAKLEN